jgi:hypothetical protein
MRGKFLNEQAARSICFGGSNVGQSVWVLVKLSIRVALMEPYMRNCQIPI